MHLDYFCNGPVCYLIYKDWLVVNVDACQAEACVPFLEKGEKPYFPIDGFFRLDAGFSASYEKDKKFLDIRDAGGSYYEYGENSAAIAAWLLPLLEQKGFAPVVENKPVPMASFFKRSLAAWAIVPLCMVIFGPLAALLAAVVLCAGIVIWGLAIRGKGAKTMVYAKIK